jgi:phage shock protein PspC (stress-responsive transcriptional regulator)
MSKPVEKYKALFEQSLFGVCDYIGEKIGIASSRIRMYFIYISFLTLGSPIILYLMAAFWINIKRYLRRNDKLILE